MASRDAEFPVAELQARIEAILRREPAAVWGCVVTSDVGMNHIAYLCERPRGRNHTGPAVLASIAPDAPLVPASCVKLFTCGLALEVALGQDAFETSAHVCGDASDTLCLHPSGDPTLTADDLGALARRAARGHDVRRVRLGASEEAGYDARHEGHHPTWEVGDLERPWAAAPSWFATVDRNAGGEFRSPRALFLSFARRALGLDDDDDDDDDETVHACEHLENLSYDARRAAAHASAPIADVARACLERSDNLFAESLLPRVRVGDRSRSRKAPAGADLGEVLTMAATEAYGLRGDLVRLVDGSGLSRHNLAPPRAFADAIQTALSQRVSRLDWEVDAARFLLDSLPVAGRTGTLAGRFAGTPAEGVVRAKTGTMTGVASLCGYFETHADPRLGNVAFAIMANNAVASAEKLRDVVDAVVCAIALARVSP
jgi:D-alanyl-D-alanine carboxypeptidase